ncbi:RNA polymerase sigma factor [Arthrobacter sp. M4]|uniref:RNA polymerase sigma factor n=1 Tax=Arthrobacter sp. M4 TaxID=218160 RepID=UPI001CDD5737|nr:sigma-70 family RNA polymerase sigma factor [Arthrobacter sp. M4]MCA4135114.1 sigma-70 family RNA polymerase sigma factor [Arthrobacter sp. M4]
MASSYTDDASFFTDVYRTFAPSVAGYLRASGVADPEGVTNDVFLALFPRLKGVHGGEQGLRTLIFSIAHARSVDHHRRRRRSPSVVEYDSERDKRLTSSAEDEALEGSPDGNALAMLDGLSDDHREVLRLRIIAELTVNQVAEIMQKTPGAITQLQHRAMKSLRELYRSANGVTT